MEISQKGSQFTFENFKVTHNNSDAYEMAVNFSESGNKAPLCLIGRSGTGKTHLLYAVKNRINELYPDLNVILTSAREFSEELIETIKSRKRQDFSEKYIDCDVLLIDDIQYCLGKESISEELEHCFNERFESGKPIMITVSERVNDLPERLRNRCFFGDYALLKNAGSDPIKNESGKDTFYSVHNDLTAVYDIVQGFLKDTFIWNTDYSKKKIIRPDYSELFKLIADRDHPELIVLASDQGSDLSSFALALAYEFAGRNKTEADYFSWKKTKEELILRLVSREACVDINSLKYNLLEVDENQRILRCSEEFKNIPLFIDDNIRDCGKLVFQKVRNRKNHGLVIADNMQMLFCGRGELSDKIREFKQLSKDCHVPVILLTELNNSDEYNKTPRFKSLRRQFDIDDVDKIIFLDKENNSSAIGKDTDITKISIVWNRNGETGEIKVYS